MDIKNVKKEQVMGFDKGMRVMEERMRNFRDELQQALDVKAAMSVSNYRHGKTRMNYPRILAVNAVFEKYGVMEPFDISE
ncbi:MAG: hypothetical protein II075_11435 [Bacteroidales bacterium]|nr:hypothetical protein [Bacteroidales bacterium]